MNSVRLVITDIDNTLVPRHKAPTPQAMRCIQSLHENKVYFGLASGRSVEEIKRLVRKWGLPAVDCIVYLNGCGLWDAISGQQEESYLMKKQWIQETLEMMKQFHANPVLYDQNHLLTRKLDPTVEMSAQSAGMDIRIASSDTDFYKKEHAKIMYRVKPEMMPIVENYLKAHPAKGYIGYKTQETLMEFSDRRVSKANALASFCQKHQIDMKDVVAFGDTTNDNTMLQISGLGVCMLNGSEDTKEIADQITKKSCEDDGWADFVESKILKVEKGE